MRKTARTAPPVGLEPSMTAMQQVPRDTFTSANPLVVHIENASSLMPVFIVRPDQYERALGRHPDIASRVRTTWGVDLESYKTHVRDAHAMITYRFPKETLASDAPNLELLQILGAGVDYLLPLDWVPPSVTMLTNSGAHVPKAAQSALMALLMLNARMPELVGSQQRRKWNRIFTTTLAGKTLLIVGVGHIGGGADQLHAVLPRADFVLLNAALTPETRFLFGAREFALMRRGAGFINMSRGGLVDPAALDDTLRRGHLGGALIDVAYPEPPGSDWPNWDTPNLIITPHVLSDDLDDYIPRTLDVFFDNLRRLFAGRPLTNVVDLARQY
jgi:phosphoglycerate dehydrogenase-like enzyme